jgi:hypothetical protein
MKRIHRRNASVCLVLAVLFGIISCNKENSYVGSTATTADSSSSSPFIVIAADSTGADSIYVLQPCARGYFRDSIPASGLLPGISSYLSDNYAGYQFLKAFVIKNGAGTVGGYVVIIEFNNKPVAVLFDANGGFVSVLEQREAGDLRNQGYHDGGRFHNRDGHHRDTVAISNLPAAILSYMATNDPQDTLVRALLNFDSSYLVISEDNGIYANLFSANGNFEKRVLLPSPGSVVSSLEVTDLPPGIVSYLNSTYPDNVLDKAFSLSINTVLKEYLMVIDANNTRYAVQFDGSGNFVSAATLW